MGKEQITRGIITKVNNEKNFIIVDRTYMVDKAKCTQGECVQGSVVEMVLMGNAVKSFRVVSSEEIKRENEEKKREEERKEALKNAWQNYWNSLPTIEKKWVSVSYTQKSIEYVGQDIFGSEMKYKDRQADYVVCIFYDEGQYLAFYTNKNDIEEKVTELQRYPDKKELKKVKKSESVRVPADDDFRYSGSGRMKDYYMAVEEQCGWKTVYQTREVEEWVYDRSNMTFASFQLLLDRVKKENLFLTLERIKGNEQWILQKFSNRRKSYEHFLKVKPFTISRFIYTDEQRLFQDARNMLVEYKGYPDCINGVKLSLNEKELLIKRKPDETAEEFCRRYFEGYYDAAVKNWDKINLFYKTAGLPEITEEQFFDVIERQAAVDPEIGIFISGQNELLRGIYSAHLLQITEFTLDTVKGKEQLWMKGMYISEMDGIVVGQCYNRLFNSSGIYRWNSFNETRKGYSDFEIIETIETDTGNKIVKAKLSDGVTYSVGQVLLYDGKKDTFLTDRRKKEMSEIVEREIKSLYAGKWNGVLENIYAEDIKKLCERIKKSKPEAVPDVVGYELERNDEIIAEAEICWIDKKIVILAPEQLEYKEIFEADGWITFDGSAKTKEILQYFE